MEENRHHDRCACSACEQERAVGLAYAAALATDEFRSRPTPAAYDARERAVRRVPDRARGTRVFASRADEVEWLRDRAAARWLK